MKPPSDCPDSEQPPKLLQWTLEPGSEAAPLEHPEGLASPLNLAEEREREECEAVISKGLHTFLEVGQALVRIRSKRLYRDHYRTFEEYCRQKWEFSKSYATRMIEAAVVAAILTPIGAKPTSESQLRPLAGLAPEKIPDAWKKAEEIAGQGEITAKVVRLAAKQFTKTKRSRARHETKKRAQSRAPVPLGQLLTLLHETKRHAEKGDTEKVLASLERIETLLCTP